MQNRMTVVGTVVATDVLGRVISISETDPEGNFVMANLPELPLTLYGYADGFRQSVPISVDLTNIGELQPIILEVLPGAISISTAHAHTLSPVAGALIDTSDITPVLELLGSNRSVWQNYWTSHEDLENERVHIELPDPPQCATPEALRAYDRLKSMQREVESRFNVMAFSLRATSHRGEQRR